jgi:20S proteasome alpha/beta subunit
LRFFNSINEAAQTLGVNTQVVRWLLEHNYLDGESRQGNWSIPVDSAMQKKEDGSLKEAIKIAVHALRKKRPRRHSRSFSRRNTHRSYVRAR